MDVSIGVQQPKLGNLVARWDSNEVDIFWHSYGKFIVNTTVDMQIHHISFRQSPKGGSNDIKQYAEAWRPIYVQTHF